jgi:aldehyde:ferredoxin oxidoreductase
VREYREKWTRDMDIPPMRWFKEPLTEGTMKGSMLDYAKYNNMLSIYYRKKGWDERGIPKKNTLEQLGLIDEANQLSMYVNL